MLRKLSPLCGIMLSQLISLSELSPLYEIALSALVSLSELSKGVSLKISMIKMCGCGLRWLLVSW